MEKELTDVISRQQAKLREQDAVLQQLSASRQMMAVVIDTTEPSAPLLAVGSAVIRGINAFKLSLDAGDSVLCDEDGRILEARQHPGIGSVAYVKKLLGRSLCEVETEGRPSVVVFGNLHPKEGDRAVLDASGSSIQQLISKGNARKSNVEIKPVHWDEVGGCEAAKQELRLLIELPAANPKLFKQYGQPTPKGVLLWGAPGCGKTLLAKAAATAISKDRSTWFRSIKGPEILSLYVGETERKIRELFLEASEHRKATSKPGVIFIDEADALLSRRGSGISSDVEKTIVPAFLAEMDGIEESGAFVILATNRPDTLDEAVTRPGRIDRSIEIGRPNYNETQEIFQIHLKNVPLGDGFMAANLAALGAEEMTGTPGIGSRLSGALIANVVQRATIAALQRDAVNGGKLTGVGKGDLQSALKLALAN